MFLILRVLPAMAARSAAFRFSLRSDIGSRR
jgi:hypothetical protein